MARILSTGLMLKSPRIIEISCDTVIIQLTVINSVPFQDLQTQRLARHFTYHQRPPIFVAIALFADTVS